MKAYIITSGNYSDYRIERVYIDKQEAETALEILDDDDKFRIETFEIGEPVEKKGYWAYLYDNSTEVSQVTNLSGYVPDHLTYKNYYAMRPPFFQIYVEAKDRETAIKVANEQRAMLKAQGKLKEK